MRLGAPEGPIKLDTKLYLVLNIQDVQPGRHYTNQPYTYSGGKLICVEESGCNESYFILNRTHKVRATYRANYKFVHFMEVLMWLDTLGIIITILYKGDRFCYFLFASLCNISFLKSGQL